MNIYVNQILVHIIIIFSIITVIALPLFLFYFRHYDDKLEERYRNIFTYISGLYYAIEIIYYNKTGNRRLTNMVKVELDQSLENISNSRNKKRMLCVLIEKYEYNYPRLFDDPSSNKEKIETLYDSIKEISKKDI